MMLSSSGGQKITTKIIPSHYMEKNIHINWNVPNASTISFRRSLWEEHEATKFFLCSCSFFFCVPDYTLFSLKLVYHFWLDDWPAKSKHTTCMYVPVHDWQTDRERKDIFFFFLLKHLRIQVLECDTFTFLFLCAIFFFFFPHATVGLGWPHPATPAHSATALQPIVACLITLSYMGHLQHVLPFDFYPVWPVSLLSGFKLGENP